MTDKLLITVCLGCLGALAGFAVCFGMKKRAEYFADLDGFLHGFSDSLIYSLDTVPQSMLGYPAHSHLLAVQLRECAEAITSGRAVKISSGMLTKAEYALVCEVFSDLGSRNAAGEKSAVENYRRRLGVFEKKAADRYSGMGKAAVKLGLLAGMLVAVLCW